MYIFFSLKRTAWDSLLSRAYHPPLPHLLKPPRSVSYSPTQIKKYPIKFRAGLAGWNPPLPVPGRCPGEFSYIVDMTRVGLDLVVCKQPPECLCRLHPPPTPATKLRSLGANKNVVGPFVRCVLTYYSDGGQLS